MDGDRGDTFGERLKAFLHRFWYGQDGHKTPWVRRLLAVLFFFALPAPVLLLLIFRFAPVPGTPQMLIRLVTLQPVHYHWRGSDAISPTLGRAVIAAEDQNFCIHNGFDWDEIQRAIKEHERHPKKRLRGGSTISQQAAREVFLTSWRSYIRKGAEAYLTVLMEALWPKKRILTVYLNVVDWGHGNFGAEAAAENYFGVSAAELSTEQSARLAAILPNPEAWKAVHPGRYVAKRTAKLQNWQSQVARDAMDWCVK